MQSAVFSFQTPPAALGLRGLACRRGGRGVFAGLDAEVAPGGALVLRGPNGSGKSTLLRLVAGLLPAAAGTIAWGGEDITRHPDARARIASYAGHLDAVKPVLTVEETLADWAALFGVPRALRAERVAAALDAFGLDGLSDMGVQILSAGQRRRLGLARLLLAHRPLWLLDEPSVALDAASVDRLAAAMAAHRAAGGLILAATHIDLALDGAQTLDVGAFAPVPEEAW